MFVLEKQTGAERRPVCHQDVLELGSLLLRDGHRSSEERLEQTPQTDSHLSLSSTSSVLVLLLLHVSSETESFFSLLEQHT